LCDFGPLISVAQLTRGKGRGKALWSESPRASSARTLVGATEESDKLGHVARRYRQLDLDIFS